MTPFEWRPYVPVAARRARAERESRLRRKRGESIEPIVIEGRKIARTFWGVAWCEHLEGFRDYANRLPRGRTYARNGSVFHLEVAQGEVRALVMGSEIYEVRVAVSTLSRKRWQAVKSRCAGEVGSLIELLEGRLSERVMAVVTDRDNGLFPRPREIRFECSCPDWAVMCKHVAAACYGVGARLDERPELLFRLRGVDHEELIAADASAMVAASGAPEARGRRRIAQDDLADVFGIELAGADPAPASGAKAAARRARTGNRRAAPDAGRGGAARGAPPPQSFTGAAVKRLRRRLELSRSEFARLLGVSAASIGNWEGTRGRLGLQQQSLAALQGAAGLSRDEALRRLRRRH